MITEISGKMSEKCLLSNNSSFKNTTEIYFLECMHVLRCQILIELPKQLLLLLLSLYLT